MIAWQATVQDESGNVVPLPVVTVYNDGGTELATIYGEFGGILPNPLTGTLEGFVQFWAVDGRYEIEGANGADRTEVWEVQLGKDGILPSYAAAVTEAGRTKLNYIQANVNGNVKAWVRRVGGTCLGGGWGPASEVTPQHWGAVANGVTDDTVALQAAFDYASESGKDVIVNSGSVAISSAVTLNISSAGGPGSEKRSSIRGASSGNTEILGLNASAEVRIVGSLTGAHSAVSGVKFNNCPLTVTSVAFLSFTDVLFLNARSGLVLQDVLSSRFFDVRWVGCTYGLTGDPRVTWSNPNALSFFGCSWRDSVEYAMKITGGTGIIIHGGSMEGNGLTGTGSERGAIRILDPGVGGSMVLDMRGVYLEGNVGTADVFVHQGTDPTVISISACTFNRLANHTTNNIRVVTSTGDGKLQLNVSDCGFENYAGFVPTTSERYINVIDDGECASVSYRGNRYETAAAMPETYGSGEAMISFSGASGSASGFGGNNVKSVERNAVGDYTVNFKRQVRTPRMVTVSFPERGTSELVVNTDTSTRVRSYDSSGNAFDPSTVWIKVDV